MGLRRVLVGIDGSPAAAEAARWAARAVDDGGEVIAVHGGGAHLMRQAVADAANGLGMAPFGPRWRQELIEEWCRPLRESGATYRAVWSDADPVEALLRNARKADVDLIVIGHHGDNGFLHRLVQGVSDHLIDHAKRPVVVVPFYSAPRPMTSSVESAPLSAAST